MEVVQGGAVRSVRMVTTTMMTMTTVEGMVWGEGDTWGMELGAAAARESVVWRRSSALVNLT